MLADGRCYCASELLLPLMSLSSIAADHRDRYLARTFTSGQLTLPYRLLKPQALDGQQEYPLVVFLHGAGERGNDNQSQLVHGLNDLASDATMARHPAFVVAPQCSSDQRWVEVDWRWEKHEQPQQPGSALAATIQLVAALVGEFPIDERRIYITGLSMGGFGAWDALARWPELFAAAAPVCGGADLATAAKIKALPVWAFHGAEDPVVKPERSRDMIAALRANGGTPKYTEYPGAGHDSWTRTYSDPALYDWLFEQRQP